MQKHMISFTEKFLFSGIYHNKVFPPPSIDVLLSFVFLTWVVLRFYLEELVSWRKLNLHLFDYFLHPNFYIVVIYNYGDHKGHTKELQGSTYNSKFNVLHDSY